MITMIIIVQIMGRIMSWSVTITPWLEDWGFSAVSMPVEVFCGFPDNHMGGGFFMALYQIDLNLINIAHRLERRNGARSNVYKIHSYWLD